MSFTDEDLKRLKDDMDRLGDFNVGNYRLRPLLTRLEAETNAADLLELHYESGVFDDLDDGDVALIIQALEARRKTEGE